MMDTTCRWGDFSATFSLNIDADMEPTFKMITRYRRYSSTYYFRPMLREGDTIIPELRRFINSLLDTNITNTFFRQIERESQLREGYYQALSNISQPY